ncbi:TetR/AcrR family transcriptional regulator [Evansella cellulosilytica]|uniref:Transcriptional regulator, TetR family n=1 Tax=Evansella cellulosilytica (strain ATCC 21833 / DSM 2522 / FERM P-1141 / JCM 9156 / N-4) TaxID=649639 RepID=E6U0P8_EVAC2|nr:TetR/AcrR family transcriptional regulator [Evansella cellulosilytica]ADU29096.1 transcriptional regulator, TetR family [Evansella cellulosilytica DSM 2522]
MKNNDFDRRVLKTRQAINEALLSLMEEKKYNKITIQDIIDRANVGRSTFYSHFATKDELLFSSVEGELEILNQYIKNYVEHDDNPRLISAIELFEHIQENSKTIKGLFKTEGANFFFEKVEAYWNTGIEEYLESKLPKGKEPKVPIKILTNHISSTLINLLKWWINNNMSYTPAEMEQYFRSLINPCIDSVIYNDSTKD